MPKDIDYEMLEAMAKTMRTMADDLDNLVERVLEGDSTKKTGAAGDVEEGRISKDIDDSDISKAVKVIKLNLG